MDSKSGFTAIQQYSHTFLLDATAQKINSSKSSIVTYSEYRLLDGTTEQKSPFYAFFGNHDEFVRVKFNKQVAGETEVR